MRIFELADGRKNKNLKEDTNYLLARQSNGCMTILKYKTEVLYGRGNSRFHSNRVTDHFAKLEDLCADDWQLLHPIAT